MASLILAAYTGELVTAYQLITVYQQHCIEKQGNIELNAAISEDFSFSSRRTQPCRNTKQSVTSP